MTTSVGGTSAGLAILGGYIYKAEVGSADSATCLADPYNIYTRDLNFSPAFLKIPFLSDVLTDTHFVTRDRMGRMLTFLAREVKDLDAVGASVIRGLGIDESTFALLNVTDGNVQFGGRGTAYVCTPMHSPDVCENDSPLTYTNISCVRFSGVQKDVYSFDSFDGTSGVAYSSSIVNGSFVDMPYGPY